VSAAAVVAAVACRLGAPAGRARRTRILGGSAYAAANGEPWARLAEPPVSREW